MHRRSLAFRLLCLSAAAATLPALVVAVVLRSISSRALETSLQQNQMEIAQRVANEVNGEIRFAQGLLGYVAQLPAVQSGNLGETRRALQNMLRSLPSVQETMAVSDAGEERVKVSRRGDTGRLIKRTLNLRERSIGAPFFSGNRLPTVLITEPIRKGGSGPTALVAKMSFSTLGALMQQANLGTRGTALIVDRQGTLLADVDESRVRSHLNLAKMPVVKDWLSRPTEPTQQHVYQDEHGVSIIGLAFPIPLLQSAVVVQQPQADAYASLENMRRALIRWASICAGFFLALTVVIAWRIQSPLRQLQAAAEQIAQGKMDVKLNIHTHDELEELGKAFSKMADSLRQSEGMRRDLINMLVHDLKSPLSSILASMDYVLTGHVGALSAEQRKFLMLGHRSGTDLLMLVQNLLDVAKLEEGKLLLNRESFAPQAWAEEVVDSFLSVAEAGKKKLSLSAPGAFPPLDGDRALLGRVLGNLLSNALRHTPLGKGEVRVTLALQKEHLSIEVSDNGQGIPREFQTKIFEKFVQVEQRAAHLRTGTGLGLTFCKMVVEAHGGRIFANSVPNEGSTFTFLLPIVAPVSASSPVRSPLASVSSK